MAVKLACDGCGCDLPLENARERGRLAKVYLCPSCANDVDLMEADIEKVRTKLVKAFEGYVARRRGQARAKVKALPDE